MSVEMLEVAARALGPTTQKVAFLGGATIGLWFTDQAARPPRVTYDVDVVAEVVTLAGYANFQAELRARRFREDIESGVICRWRHDEAGLILDAVPAEPSLVGFGGRWLRPAAAAAVDHTLPSGATIKVVPPAYLMATKLEAFTDRGHDDCLASKDFEDIILLVDSRDELFQEFDGAPPDFGTTSRPKSAASSNCRRSPTAPRERSPRQTPGSVSIPRLRSLAE